MRGHSPDRLASAEHRAEYIYSKDSLDPRGLHGIKAHLRLKGRRVVDESGDLTQYRINPLIERQNAGLGTDVSVHRDRVATFALNIANQMFGCVATVLIVDADGVPTYCGEFRRCSGADPPSASGNDHNRQVTHSPSPE